MEESVGVGVAYLCCCKLLFLLYTF